MLIGPKNEMNLMSPVIIVLQNSFEFNEFIKSYNIHNGSGEININSGKLKPVLLL